MNTLFDRQNPEGDETELARLRATNRFAPPVVPFQPHSDTSVDAAYAKQDAETDRRIVLDFIKANGGATDDEGLAYAGVGQNSYRARRIELVRQGLVRDSGRKKQTRSNRSATVWAALEQEGQT